MSKVEASSQDAQASRRAKLIALLLAVAGAFVALGGGAMLFFMRSIAPNDAYESVVLPDLPMRPGDLVAYRSPQGSCEERVVRAVLPDGRIEIEACTDDGRTLVVHRPMLRVPRFPNEHGKTEPLPGDELLVQVESGFLRATLVSVEPQHKLRVLPLKGSARAPREVPQGSVFLVRRPKVVQAP